MAEYHVGCGAFGIYAGTLKPNGEEWRNKSDVTDEAISATAQHLLQQLPYNYDVVVQYRDGGGYYYGTDSNIVPTADDEKKVIVL